MYEAYLKLQGGRGKMEKNFHGGGMKFSGTAQSHDLGLVSLLLSQASTNSFCNS